MATRTRAPRTQPAVRRAQLLDEGSRLFARHGFANVTVEQIARAVGLVKAGFYHHFESKQELLTAIVVETYEAGLQILADIDTDEGSARERVGRYVREHAHWVVTHSDRVEIIRREAARLSAKRLREVVAFRRRFADVLSTQIAQGQVGGEFAPTLDPHLAAHEILGMLNWLAQWHGHGTEDQIVEQVARQAVMGLAAD